MKAIHFSAETGNEISAHEVHHDANIVGFCSWKRLAEIFRRADEVRTNETLSSFQIDDRGITFRIR